MKPTPRSSSTAFNRILVGVRLEQGGDLEGQCARVIRGPSDEVVYSSPDVAVEVEDVLVDVGTDQVVEGGGSHGLLTLGESGFREGCQDSVSVRH